MTKTPERIVSLLPSTTEIVSVLGLQEKLVGVTHECDFPPGVSNKPHITESRISHETMSSKEIDHAVRTQLDGHGSIYDLDEGLLGILDPDLILTQELCDVCAVNYEMVAKSAGIFAADAKIVSLEPTTISEILESIVVVGEICGIKERAAAVVEQLEARITLLQKQTETIKTRPNVFMLEWLEPPFAPGHWVPEQVNFAGGNCLLGNAGQKSTTTTFEELIESNPDVIALIPCGYYIDDILRQLPVTNFPPEFLQLKAIRDGNVWALDASSYFSRPGPRVVDGAEILAKVLHPEIFGLPQPIEALKLHLTNFKKRSAGTANN